VDRDGLAEYLYRPEAQDDILGGYEGGYALSLTEDPKNPEHVAILVRIEGSRTGDIAKYIWWGKQKISVIPSPNFEVPWPQ
jgi:hypothetical protein